MNKFLAQINLRANTEKDEKGAEVRRIRGIASTGSIDRQNTWVNPKTFAAAARKFKKNNGKLFLNHNWAMPIGRVEEFDVLDEKIIAQSIVGHGFQVPVTAGFLGVPVLMSIDDIWKIMEQELMSSHSIAFNANEVPGDIIDEKTGRRGPSRLDVTEILELSVVTIPANADCEFSITRAMDDPAYSAALRFANGTTALSREDLWGIRLDGAAAAAAVGLEDADQDDGADPIEMLDAKGNEDWARIREELEKCRL